MSAEWVTETGTEARAKLFVNGQLVYQGTEITADKVREEATSAGLKRFIVKDEEGNMLKPSDFPINEGNVYIEEYDEGG